MTITECQPKLNLNPLIMGIMNENNATKLEILNHLIYLSTRFKSVFISQGTLAAKYGVSLRQINRLLSQWKSEGVLKYRQQGFNRSCIYHLNPLLAQEKNRLKFKLPAAVLLLAISSLCSAAFSSDVLLSNNKNIYNYNSSFRFIDLPQLGYQYDEQGYSEAITINLFINKESITIEKHQLCPKESVMSQQAIITLISQAYNLSIDQQEQLSRYSFEALEYARKELYRQNKQNSLMNPQSATSWFSAVAHSFDKKGSQPKTGKTMGYAAKKVVYGGTNNNHSSSTVGADPNNPDDPLHLSEEDRIKFAQEQIEFFDGILNEGESILLQDQPRVRGGGFRSLGDVMKGMAPNMKDRWKDLKKNPKSVPSLMNGFKVNLHEDSVYSEGEDYEEHLDSITKGMPDPEGYKLMLRKRDYRATARK